LNRKLTRTENLYAEAVIRAAGNDLNVEQAAANAYKHLAGMILHSWCAKSWADRKAFAAEVIEDKVGLIKTCAPPGRGAMTQEIALNPIPSTK